MVWMIVVRDGQPGHKGWFKVKFGEGGRGPLEMKLPW